MNEPINNIRWLETFRPEASRHYCPRTVAFLILALALAAWSLVGAVVLSLV